MSVLATNDDWGGNPDLISLAAQVGAFPLAGATSKDAAIAALPIPGGYSIQLSSVDFDSGNVLAEIYDASTAFNAGTPGTSNRIEATMAVATVPLPAHRAPNPPTTELKKAT